MINRGSSELSALKPNSCGFDGFASHNPLMYASHLLIAICVPLEVTCSDFNIESVTCIKTFTKNILGFKVLI